MAKQKSIEPTARYSFIYNNLVNNSEDFIGLVAYSIYKQEKIEYIKKFEEIKKKSPTPDELIDFHRQAKNRIDQYKEMATTRVNKFCNEIYSMSATDLKKELVKKKCFGWLAAITQSAIGSILGSLAIGVLIIALLYSRYGLEWIIKDAIRTYNTPQITSEEALPR